MEAAVGKRTLEWDLNAWNWDGDLFMATQPASASTSTKRTKPACQVDACAADLSLAKDYHRRHKVCEFHSKASSALVSNALQRFCQQCSRFHLLPEFDDGKRSCRRRLAGHNKRRRKALPDPAAAPTSNVLSDTNSTYLLINLLRLLSNMHSNTSDHTATDRDLLSHLLTTLGRPSLPNNDATSVGNSDVVSTFLPPTPIKQKPMVNTSGMTQKRVHLHNASSSEIIQPESSVKPILVNSPPSYSEPRDDSTPKMNNFDLNDIYVDSDDGPEDPERSPPATNLVATSLHCPSPWLQQHSSPPQTSGNSDSASAQSPSSSSGEAQSRTDRIVFKLFGKDPSDFPLVLRAQILDWLSSSPSEIESYIRPGCVILTIYLRQSEADWEDLCYDLSSSLSRLVDVSDDSFWRSGWIFIRAQHQIAFVYNGQVVVDAALSPKSRNHSKILSVKPIAVSTSDGAQFSVIGTNLAQPTARLFCALEGKYLFQEATQELMGSPNNLENDDRCINFSCPIPVTNGRGFIEIEDQDLGSSYFPFIVAEEDVCTEIRMLESALECIENNAGKTDTYNQAVDFLNEMGWLLHRSQLRSRLGHLDPNAVLFPVKRFKWLVEFSVDNDWCAVVRKLLDILHDGCVGAGDDGSLSMALSEIGLLHRAVRRNSRDLVETLLRYIPKNNSLDSVESENNTVTDRSNQGFMFRPDVVGPAGLTPLHIAAGKDGSEDVLDALTNDPGSAGIEAWKNSRDSTGSTPEDYARLRGHYSYIRLIQRKLNKRPASGHVVVDIPPNALATNQKQTEVTSSFEIGRPQLKHNKRPCNLCDRKMVYGTTSMSVVYRPAMLSMVAVAAVCVCVALLFKSSPEVIYVFQPFRWERLEFGTS